MGETMSKLKGHAKQAMGEATDDKPLEREGKIDRAKGKAEGLLDSAADKAKQAVNRDDSSSDRA